VREEFTIKFSFNNEGKLVNANLIGVRDLDNLCELFNAERLWVEKTEDTQVEFGRYTLGISHKYYTEVSFDEFAE
jgi:hypothetical protein